MTLLSTLARRAALALAGTVLIAAPAAAQPFAQPAAGDTALRIVLLTMGPGDEVWEKFGHNAIWVHDPATGSDKAYNYGMFDFRQENFILNFARGRMNYWMEGFDAYLTIDHYRRLNRTVWAQELNLAPGQARQIKALLERNELPENRFYRYDYYRDNCSTRVRDIIDAVLGGTLRRATNGPSGSTYRWHTRRLVGQGAGNVPIFTAIDFGLGPAADRPISKWDEMFLPMKLRDEVAALRLTNAAGQQVPLVLRQQTLFTATRPAEPQAPPAWLGGYLLAGLLGAGLIVGLTLVSRRSGAARFGLAAVSGTWLLFAGIAGFTLLGLWFLTDHAIAYRNENLFYLSPLALPLAVLMPALAFRAKWARWWGARLAIAMAVISLVGLVLQALPLFPQVDGYTVALALPINLAIAWAAWFLAGLPPRAKAAAKTPAVERKRVAA